MKIKYLGHAAFQLTLASGARYVIDPYTAGARHAQVRPDRGNFDVAIVSHNHEDHVEQGRSSHRVQIVNKSGKVKFPRRHDRIAL